MAFKLRETMRVLLSASQQIRGRVLPLYSCYFHTDQQQQQDLLQLPNNLNKVYGFRRICSDQDPTDIKQVGRNKISDMASDRFHSAEEIRNAFIQNFNADHAIKVISNLHANGYDRTAELTDEILTHLINSDENRAEEASTFLKGLVENEIPIIPVKYNQLLQVLRRYDMHNQFFELVYFMEDNGIEANVHQQYQILQMTAKIGNSDIARLCFDTLNASEEFPDKKYIYYAIIRAYSKNIESQIEGKESENALVVRYYNEMILNGYKPDAKISKLAMKSYLRSGDEVRANQLAEEQEVLKEIVKDIILNFNTLHAIEEIYNLHNKGFCRTTILIEMILTRLFKSDKNHAEEALTFLKGLVEKKIPISSISYTRVLLILCQYEMYNQFLALVCFMEDNGIEVNVHQQYQILQMTAKIGNSDIAQICFDKLNASEKFLEKKYSYYEIIKAYSKNIELQIKGKKSENALVVLYYNEMILKGYKDICDEIKELAMEGYLRFGNFEDAIQVADKSGVLAEIKNDLMFNFNTLDAIEDVQQYHQILTKAAKAGNGSVAQSCFDKLIGSEEFPDKQYLYITLMKAYYKESKIEDSETKIGMVIDCYNKMITEGYNPDTKMNRLAIRSYLRLWDFAGANRVVEKCGQEKEALKHFMEFQSAKLAIKFYLESGDIESANQTAEKSDYKDGLQRFINRILPVKVDIEGGNKVAEKSREYKDK